MIASAASADIVVELSSLCGRGGRSLVGLRVLCAVQMG